MLTIPHHHYSIVLVLPYARCRKSQCCDSVRAAFRQPDGAVTWDGLDCRLTGACHASAVKKGSLLLGNQQQLACFTLLACFDLRSAFAGQRVGGLGARWVLLLVQPPQRLPAACYCASRGYIYIACTADAAVSCGCVRRLFGGYHCHCTLHCSLSCIS